MYDQFPIPMHEKPLFAFEDVKDRHNGIYVKSYYHHFPDFIPHHTHDFYEINIVTAGVGKHLLGDRELLTQKGDVFIIPPHTRHGYSCKDGMTVYHILLSPLFLASFSPMLEKMRGFELLFHYEPLLREHLSRPFYLKSGDISFEVLKRSMDLIEDWSASEQEYYEMEKVAHTVSLIGVLSKAIHERNPLRTDAFSGEHVLTIIESMDYLDTHAEEKLDFQELARRSALSYSTYLRYFKKLAGTTPARYQTDCRIQRAVTLLLNGDDSILDVALSCGFYDSSHFIREFIRRKKISPGEFRRQAEKT